MIACGSFLATDQCVSAARCGANNGLVSIYRDRQWDEIHTEAIIEADQEPLLRPLIQQCVLDSSSFGDGLALLISQRLGDGVSGSAQLYELFCDVIAENPGIRESAGIDLAAIRANDPAASSLLHPFLNFKGFHAVQAYRIANALWSNNRRGLAYHIQNRISDIFNVDIHPAATIGSGVFIDHASGVVIGETAFVGDDVTILHGVTLGGTGKDRGDRHPKIGRGVLIGANAQLLGNIEVGEGSSIGASSVVLKNVEPYSTVAGVPAQVVRREGAPTIALKPLAAAGA